MSVIEQPPIRKTDLWEHQAEAYAFAADKRAAMLAMAMGTGKSRVAVDLVQNWASRRVLIICPVSVRGVWRREFERWAVTDYVVTVLDKGSTDTKADVAKDCLTDDAPHTVVVVNYESAWRGKLGEALKREHWCCVILDESHRVKSHSAKAAKFVAKLSAQKKLALTGTPMPHSPLDVFGQALFLEPRIFGSSFHRFKTTYAILKEIPGISAKIVDGFQNLDDLQEKFGRIAYQVGADVLDLPDAQHIIRDVELSPKARKVYHSLEKELIAEVEEGVVTAGNALVRLLRMSQVTSGTLPIDDADTFAVVSTDKRDVLLDLLSDIDAKESVVVFGRFRPDLACVEHVAHKLGREYTEISGRRKDLTSHSTMLPINGQVCGVNIQSGGVGIDLTQARYCVFFSAGYSLGDYEQALARTHRPGQTRPVVYFHLVCRDTVDVDVYKALDAKRDVITSVLEGMKKHVNS